MITQQRLKDLFDYSDGQLIRKISRGAGKNPQRWKEGTALGHKIKNGYCLASVDYKIYKLHRLIWLWHFGRFPKGHLDHIDCNPGNNKIENLREANTSQNMQNQQKPRKNNKCGFQGVCKNGTRFRAALWLDGKRIHIGYFDTPEQAHKAYVEAKRKYHPFGRL